MSDTFTAISGADHGVAVRGRRRLPVRLPVAPAPAPNPTTAPANAKAEPPIAVVLIHCWTGDAAIWDLVADRLVAAGHDVVQYDLRGHGRSGYDDDVEPDLGVLVDDLAAVLDVAGLERAVVVGHSLGGMIALEAVLRRDPRLVGLGLVATSARPTHPLPGVIGPLGRALARALSSKAGARLIRSPLGAAVVRPVLGRRPSTTARTETLRTLRHTPPEVADRQFRALLDVDLVDRLAALRIPTVIVAGSRDLLLPAPHARLLARSIPGALLTTLHRAGHMLPLERPAEVADAIDALIRLCPPDPAPTPTPAPTRAGVGTPEPYDLERSAP